MSKLTLTIDTGNAAFEDGGVEYELARYLERVADSIMYGSATGKNFGLHQNIRDINGNIVGTFCLGDLYSNDGE